MKKTGLILLLTLVSAAMALECPGLNPEQAEGAVSKNNAWLGNNVIQVEWRVTGGKLQPYLLQNKLTGKAFKQNGTSLFKLNTGKKKQGPMDKAYFCLKQVGDDVSLYASADGKDWILLKQVPNKQFKGSPAFVRFGKTDGEGRATNHKDAGPAGKCAVAQCLVNGKAVEMKVVGGSKKGQAVAFEGPAHHAAYAEAPVKEKFEVSCAVKKGNDQGQTWGPGLAVTWDSGSSMRLAWRTENKLSINVNGKEELVGFPELPQPMDLTAEAFDIVTRPELLTLKGNPGAARLAERMDGKMIRARLQHKPTGIQVVWEAELRDKANYISQTYHFRAENPVSISAMQLLDAQVDGCRQVGRVPGSPVMGSGLFFGVELPVCNNLIQPTGTRIGFPCQISFQKKVYSFSSVTGVTPETQKRRGFLYYLEMERAHPYWQFLHYNCWYDLGLNPTEKDMIRVIKEYHKYLTEKGVNVQSFVVDDGWDNYGAGLWPLNEKKFPNGFDPLCKALEDAESYLGVWISPLGGYTGQKERIQHAKNMGLISGDELDLSEEGYYNWFRNKCLKLMKDHKVNYFKWDKAGSGVSPHFMALLNVAEELRSHDPDLFLNVTVGTWPSPFWLNHVDCTWRHGADVGWTGKGDDRETWLTYRDKECYDRVVQAAPLYPVNSIMLHGVVHGRHFQATRVSKAGTDLKNEVRSFFGTGVNLQELYLTPEMMTEEAWSHVEEAARWAKAHEDVLVDTHWVGGDPGELQVYGYAAWNNGKGVMTLRNPDDKEKSITLDLRTAFEMFDKKSFQLKAAYTDQRIKTASGDSITLTLKPFEVLVFNAR